MNTALDPAAEPYEDSRRLTGCNFYFSGTGAVLEAAPGLSFDDATLARWRDNIDLAREALGWPDGEAVMRRHRSGVSLRSEEHTSELQSLMRISYAVLCLQKKKKQNTN